MSDLPDLELVTLAQAGSEPAVAELWVRHYGATLRTASRVARQPRDAEEIASDAFTAMIQACRNGHGPTTSVRAYLATSVRNLAGNISTGPRAAEILSDDIATFDHAATTDPDQVAHLAELSIIREAFAALPQRWQIVLWRTAVDHENHQNVADAMGLTRNGVAALALRARKALKTAYLQAHVSRGTVEPTCQPFLPLLADATQHPTITDPDLTDHLADCHRCRDRLAELRLIDQNLAGIVLPAALALTTTITTTTAAAAAAGATTAGSAASSLRHLGQRVAQARHALAGGGAVATAAAVAISVAHGGTPPPAAHLAPPTPGSPVPTKVAPQHSTATETASPTTSAPEPVQSSPLASDPPTPRPEPTAPAPDPDPTTPPPDPTTVVFSPAVVDLSLSGPQSAVVVDVQLSTGRTTSGVQLQLTVPTGVTLAGSSGDWAGCTQDATTITCSDPHASTTATGSVTTSWDATANGTVSAQVTGSYLGGTPFTGALSASWPPS